MNTNPFVSIIVCTYNRPVELQRALQSIWDQDYKNFEVIVVDDGSEKEVGIPDYWDEKLTKICIKHGGVGAARAVG
jgi:glycosyltransferase involved in cell wall biosynthesis